MPRKKKVKSSPVPPTHQSSEMLTGCRKNYVTQVIEGRKNPGGVESLRGREIHHVMSQYLAHCASKQVPMDLVAFDTFAKGAGPIASKILVGIRDSYRVDWGHLLMTEVPMCMDEKFRPTRLEKGLKDFCKDSGDPVAYEGTPDGIFLFREERKILCDDFKSHPRPYSPADPDKSIQGKMYSLFCFTHFPWVEEVCFRLLFVRFNHVTRDAVYRREDIPQLIEAVRAMRDRQKAIHADYAAGKEIEATGNNGCFYCPLLASRECPILHDNPNTQMTPEEWASSELVYSAYQKVNRARMKAWVDANGKPIVLKDYNGKCFSYGPQDSVSDTYPLFKPDGDGLEKDAQGRILTPIVDFLVDHAHADPDDTGWMQGIQISSTSIRSFLKTRRRTILDQAVDSQVEKVTKVKMKMSKPLETLPADIEEDEEEGDEAEEF